MKINSTKVAQLAGVSRSTVSRVINNYSNVPPETKEIVLKAIKELGYIPNSSAQVLAGKKSKTIGLFIYGDNSDKNRILDNGLSFGYYLDFINRALKESLKLEYQLLVDVINDDSFHKVESLYINRSIVGGIFIGFKEDDKNLENLLKKFSPLVLIDYTLKPKCLNDGVYYINTEDFTGAFTATRHLIELGKRKIIHISGDKEKISGKERERGYLEAVQNFGIAPMIYNGNYSDEKATEIVKNILKEKIEFDAVFCANDNMSYCVNRILKENGIDTVSIVGFDNLRNTIPLGIMSVAPDINSLAKMAVELLINVEKDKTKINFVKTRLIKSLEEYIKESYLD
ncbi:LacI family DNA-binding transcriptional regulator [Cetobacterium sp.]|uniref:LacI family DNA-binding transcriptional regulator n=1 Tax=Cetobacterium sp. TaxID=2071632 RepID=UPI0025DD6A75|nr:LacI family DNA-binding transcriptional regulator [uncultured Cetobacterium sp.]